MRRAHRIATSSEAQLTFWRSSAERLVGRAKYLGEWQALCDQAVEWLERAHGVLWVTDFVHLLDIGGESAADSMAAYLLPALRHGSLRLIGEANPSELEAARQRLPGFIECFEPLHMAEMDGTCARRVLDSFAAHAHTTLSVQIEPSALATGYRLLNRFVRYESFPGKAVRFFGDCVRAALADRIAVIDEAAVIAHFAKTTGLPKFFVRDEPLDESALHAFFARQLFGQDEAIARLKEVLYLFKAGLNDPAKPIATLLFAGPTGVGKTAAARRWQAMCSGQAAAPTRSSAST